MRRNDTKVIGITGGIGSGKSTVAGILRDRYGACCVSADTFGHLAMQKGSKTYARMVEEFGKEILDGAGDIDRRKLSDMLLASEEKMKIQNGIVHPFVISLIKEKIEEYRKEGAWLVLVESAILFEAGCGGLCDEAWFVSAGRETRKRRLAESRGYADGRTEAFMAMQQPDSFYLKRCSKVIYNDGDMENLSKQLEKCIEDLRAL